MLNGLIRGALLLVAGVMMCTTGYVVAGVLVGLFGLVMLLGAATSQAR